MKVQRVVALIGGVLMVGASLAFVAPPAEALVSEPTGLPVFTGTPPAVVERVIGSQVTLGWTAVAPGDPGRMVMRMQRSIDGGPWADFGATSDSSSTSINAGTFFAVTADQSGQRFRAVASSIAGAVRSEITTLIVCAGPLPCTKKVVPGGASVVEGDVGSSVLQVPVMLTSPSSVPVTVEWSTVTNPGWSSSVAAEPGVDYVAASGVLTFAPGQVSASVPVAVLGDDVVEADELLVVSFRNPTNATMGGFWGLGFGGISNDDPSVVPGGASVAEGDAGSSVLQVPVTLSSPSSVPVTVEWSTVTNPGWSSSVAAEPGVDYVAASGVVTFAPGEVTASVPITVLGDDVVEADELLVVSFRNPTNATMGGFWGLGFGGISNDD